MVAAIVESAVRTPQPVEIGTFGSANAACIQTLFDVGEGYAGLALLLLNPRDYTTLLLLRARDREMQYRVSGQVYHELMLESALALLEQGYMGNIGETTVIQSCLVPYNVVIGRAVDGTVLRALIDRQTGGQDNG